MDFPQGRVSLMDAAAGGYLSTFGPESQFGTVALTARYGGAGAVWPSANLALYMPVLVTERVTVYHMGTEVTTQAGNIDVGIYDEALNRLVNAGTTATAVAGIQDLDIADTAIGPGLVYFAMVCDSTTAAFRRISADGVLLRTCGMAQQALGSASLPSSATFAANANGYVPHVFASLLAAAL